MIRLFSFLRRAASFVAFRALGASFPVGLFPLRFGPLTYIPLVGRPLGRLCFWLCRFPLR